MSEELKPTEQEQTGTTAEEQTTAPVEATPAEAQPVASEVPAETPAETPSATADEATDVHEAETAGEAETHAPNVDVEAILAELKEVKKANGTIDVVGSRRIRGGILVEYKGFTMFLPTTHLSLKENPSENDLLSLLQKTFPVCIHEVSDAEKKKVIVTRRPLLRREIVSTLEVGGIYEGKVVSVTSFGIFVDINGAEGMVHVSRISNRRVDDPSKMFTKGDVVKVKIREISPKAGRLALSMKELESNPWDAVGEKLAVGDKLKATVKNMSDFGAYVQIAELGIEGMIHISELSWMRRISHPSEILAEGQEVEVVVLRINTKDRKLALSYKQTLANPWDTMKERFEIGTQVNGTVRSFRDSGAVVGIADDVDGFLPRGKMTPAARAKKAPFEVGEQIPVLIMDVVPESQSIILGMEGFDQGDSSGAPRRNNNNRERTGGERQERGERGERPRRQDQQKSSSIPSSAQAGKGGVTLSDLLSDEEKKRLFGDGASE